MQFADTAAINNTAPPLTQETADDEGPRFIASRYPNGLMTVCVEGLDDEDANGWPLLSFHAYSGVEIGPSFVFAAMGDVRMTLFAGTFEEHRECFRQWEKLAMKNRRPSLLVKQGVEALAALGPVPPPPFPPIDKAATARANKVLREARKRLAKEIEAGGELTLDRCRQIVEQTDKEMAMRSTKKRRARSHHD